MSNQQAPKPVADPHAQRAKALASTVKRLRGWAGSDPSRAPELAAALVELTGHRLLGHAYAVAAPEGQEAVRRSAEVLGASGPIGPYTSITDAARYVTAVVHLATLQVGLSLPDAAGRTLESVTELRSDLRARGLEDELDPSTAIWAMTVRARAALAAGEVADANAYADAALARLAGSGQRDDPDAGYLTLDVDRLVSDTRWAAGRPEDSLAALHLTLDRYRATVADRLAEPGRLSPALVERLSEPMFALHRDIADRLAAHGDVDLGLVTRRDLVDRLRTLVPRLGDRARSQLALALADLADDLLRSDRVEEADEVAVEAVATRLDGPIAEPVRLLAASARARVLTRTGRAREAADLLSPLLANDAGDRRAAGPAAALLTLVDALRAEGDEEAAEAVGQSFGEIAREILGTDAAGPAAGRLILDRARGVVSLGSTLVSWPASEETAVPDEAARQRETAAWLEAERADAHRRELEYQKNARIEAERRAAARQQAERAAVERAASDQLAAAQARRLAAERQAAAEEAERQGTKRRREQRLEEHRLEVERRAAEQREAERREAEGGTAEPQPTLAEPVEAPDEPPFDTLRERQPIEAAHPIAEPRPTPAEPQPTLAEPVEAPDEPPFDKLRERQPIEAAHTPAEPQPTPAEPQPTLAEPVEAPDEVAVAEEEWRAAQAQRDRRRTRAALEQFVELLRPRAEADLAAYGRPLQQALEDLAGVRLRGGDLWGSRAPAKEAKALAKRLGH